MGVPAKSTSIGAGRSDMATEGPLSLDLQRESVCPAPAVWPWAGRLEGGGSHVGPQLQRQRLPTGLRAGMEGGSAPRPLGRGRCLEPGQAGTPGRDRSLCKGPEVRHGHL